MRRGAVSGQVGTQHLVVVAGAGIGGVQYQGLAQQAQRRGHFARLGGQHCQLLAGHAADGGRYAGVEQLAVSGAGGGRLPRTALGMA